MRAHLASYDLVEKMAGTRSLYVDPGRMHTLKSLYSREDQYLFNLRINVLL
jgi:hypothetical protein